MECNVGIRYSVGVNPSHVLGHFNICDQISPSKSRDFLKEFTHDNIILVLFLPFISLHAKFPTFGHNRLQNRTRKSDLGSCRNGNRKKGAKSPRLIKCT